MTSDIGSEIVVVGAGLSGLRVASLLCQRGVPCSLLDARAEAGGRASSVVSRHAENAVFDVGPTWYWPERQLGMQRLVSELGLGTFAQPSAGAALIERFRLERAQEYVAADANFATSLRFQGGVRSLVDALLQTLLRSRSDWRLSDVSSRGTSVPSLSSLRLVGRGQFRRAVSCSQ